MFKKKHRRSVTTLFDKNAKKHDLLIPVSSSELVVTDAKITFEVKCPQLGTLTEYQEKKTCSANSIY